MNTPIQTGSGPYVKLFCVKRDQQYMTQRDRIIHAQTHKDNDQQTFVAFLGPQDERMFATLDMTVNDFFNAINGAFNEAPTNANVDDVLQRP